MKILLVSNFYYNRGGDCTYLFSLKKLLEEKGHQVVIFSMHHPQNFDSEYSEHFVSYINYDEIVRDMSVSSGFKVLNRAVYSREAERKIQRLIEIEKPDVAHLQNIHHHITPSIIYTLKKHGIPVIWTLHDFTLICPNTSFLAHDKICEKCKKRQYFWPSIVKCKKDSFSASTMAALETTIHRIMKVNELVDVFIAPSQFLRNKLIEYGFVTNKIICLNNFNNVELTYGANDLGDYYLYVGRISHEKGVKTLIDAAIKVNSGKLKIVGDGPLTEEMMAYVKSKSSEQRIEFLGHMSHEEVIELIKKSQFLVLPSECYENFPYSILEASACGKPAIASRIGGIPEVVRNWETGLLFEPGNSENLYLKIKYLVNHPQKAAEMGEHARTFIQTGLSSDQYYEKLIEIYKNAMSLTTVS